MAVSSTVNARAVLSEVLSLQLAPELYDALTACLAARPLATSAVLSAFASAGRKLGVSIVALPEEPRGLLRELGYRNPERASVAELGRAFVLVSACVALDAVDHLALLTRAYRSGSNEERVALLRSLPLLPEPARFLPIATDACRSHVLTVFEAIACHNPYPALYFDEASFNQLIVKALFVGASLADIEGLAPRTTPELKRMVRDYVSERRAAARAFSADVTLVDPEISP